MRKFLLLPGLLTAPMIALMLVAMAVGQALGQSPSGFNPIDDCHLPCWNGIRPGETTLLEADTLLTERGYRLATVERDGTFAIPNNINYVPEDPNAVCHVGLGRVRLMSTTVSEMTLQVCEGASLGHIVSMIGEPEGILPFVSLVSYKKNTVTVVLRSEMCRTPLTPHSDILFIVITQPVGSRVLTAEQILESQEDSTILPWRGFLPVWRYDRLFPGRVVCY